MAAEKSTKKRWLKPLFFFLVLVVIVVLLRITGVTHFFSGENIGKVEAAIQRLGIWGPLVYILLYIAATVLFLPGLPITLLGGIFGAIRGTIYVSIASTLGASAAFLIARYALRPMVEEWVARKPTFQKIDEGVKEHGWRMVMITRLVPVFPFNLQNYAYGLTKVPFLTYFIVSWLCMLPGTVAYVFAGGSIISGEGNVKKTLTYLAIAAVFFVILSFVPRLIKRRYALDPGSELQSDEMSQ